MKNCGDFERHTDLIQARSHPDYSHSTHRAWCGKVMLHVYHRNPKSPSGVFLAASGDYDCEECRGVVGQVHAGPTRGDIAAEGVS